MHPDANRKDILFYDGGCGLCHRFVKWTLRHDPDGIFHFSPLQGETIKQQLSAEERANLPDSVAVKTSDGRLLTKSAAAEYVIGRLGLHRATALIGVLPRWLTDLGYDVIARARYPVFGRKTEMCPLVPEGLRERFLP